MAKTRFAELIEVRLREQSISQQALADRSDLSQASVHRFLNKTEKQLLNSKLSTFVELARATNVDLISLLSTIVPPDVIRLGGNREEIARSISLLPEEKRKVIVELIKVLTFGRSDIPSDR